MTHFPNEAGSKRPIVKRNGKPTPVPWVMGPYHPNENPETENGQGWKYVYRERAENAQEEILCLVCGLPLSPDKPRMYALISGNTYSDERTFFGTPSPTFGHPRCILTAALHCPHLQNQRYVAILDGKKLTVDELKAYVKETS